MESCGSGNLGEAFQKLKEIHGIDADDATMYDPQQISQQMISEDMVVKMTEFPRQANKDVITLMTSCYNHHRHHEIYFDHWSIQENIPGPFKPWDTQITYFCYGEPVDPFMTVSELIFNRYSDNLGPLEVVVKTKVGFFFFVFFWFFIFANVAFRLSDPVNLS